MLCFELLLFVLLSGANTAVAIVLPDPAFTQAAPQISGFETISKIHTGDLNSDLFVNMKDLNLFLMHWLEIDCEFDLFCQGADLNYDGKVDMADFAIMTQNWLRSADSNIPDTNSPASNMLKVNPGPDQVLIWPQNMAVLKGTVTDDGLMNPPKTITTVWTTYSGAGTVLYADTNDVNTTATFSQPGIYVLRLTATDGQLTAYNDVYISVNQYVTSDFVLTSIPKFTQDATAASSAIIPHCETSNFVWGVGNGGFLFKLAKAGSSDWVRVGSLSGVGRVYNNGDHLFYFGWDNPPVGGKYSSDEGNTWTNIDVLPDFDPNVYPHANWHNAANGLVSVIGEYGIPSKGYKLFYTTDYGKNWHTGLTVAPQDVDAAQNFHCHTIGWHKGTSQFIAAFGDGPNRRFYTSKDGISWAKAFTNLPANGNIGLQPLQFVDYDHPTRILCGDDAWKGGYWLDLVSGDAASFLSDRWSVFVAASNGICTFFKKLNGIYYFCEYQQYDINRHPDKSRNPKIFVSLDGEHWATYYQFPSSSVGEGVRYAGYAQGKIYNVFNTSNGPTSFQKMTTPVLATSTGILIQSQAINYLNTPDKSSFASFNALSAWVEDNGSTNTLLSWYPMGGIFNPGCLNVKKAVINNTANAWIRPVSGGLQLNGNGRNYYSRLWIKGYSGQAAVAGSSDSSMHNVTLTNAREVGLGTGVWSKTFSRTNDYWTEILAVDSIPTSSNTLATAYLQYYMGNTSGDIVGAGEDFNVYLGGAVVSDAPVTFIEGGSNQTQTKVQYSDAVKDDWTVFTTILPDVGYAHVKDFYDTWNNSINYDCGDYVIYGTGTGPGKLYQSTNSKPQTGDVPGIAPSWTEIAADNVLPRWHIETLDFGYGNKLVIYLDCMPEYSSGITVNGRKLKLDIYVDGIYKQTLAVNSPFIWDRRSQWNFAVACDKTTNKRIYWYLTHSGLQAAECHISTNPDVTTAISNGKFSNRPMVYNFGDMPNYRSLTFYLMYHQIKKLDFAIEITNDIETQMNNISINN